MLKATLHRLSYIVKQNISLEMKEAKQGAIMHDGWTLSGVHCIGLFVCYLIKKKNVVDGKPHVTEVPFATLTSCAPIKNVDANLKSFARMCMLC